MPDASSPASAATTTPPAPDSPLMSLYRHALGPVGVERNIRVFSVFEATGRTRPSWNWAAAFLTLHWMVFYRLWRPAGLYAFLAALLLGLFWLVDAASMPTLASVRWWLLLAFAVAGTLLPGLYGDALLYAQTELRVHNAIAASQTLGQARTLLARRAGTGRRIGWQALAHLLLLALGGVLALVGMAPPPAPTLQNAGPEPTMASPLPSPATPSAESAPILPIQGTMPITTAPSANVTTPPPSALAVPAATSSPPTAVVQAAPPATEKTTSHAAPAHSAATAAAVVPAQEAPEPHRRPAKIAVKPTPEPPKPQAKVYSSRDASQPAPPPAPIPTPIVIPDPPPARPSSSQKTPAKAPAKVAVQAATRPAATANAVESKDKEQSKDKAGGRFFIHAGTFALTSNAEKVHARIERAGLPATLQNFTNADKELVRVRVGPFASRAEADRAAAKLRAMGLDAMIYGR